ncbi:MAG: thermonuclease family protein [Candidatus Omnitrophota bacterium]|nr:thermonuclease family protein [Candidatus Omnitrophota bacterium]
MLSRKALFFILFFCLSSAFINGYIKADDELRVTKVIDGDTIVLENGEHVRYIGMDAPEKGRPYYGEATRENKRLVNGKKVRLEYDVERTDRYGRTLAYVYTRDIFVNAELVGNGYAMIYTFPPNVKYYKTFLALQEEARKQKRGLWGLSEQDIKSIKGGHKQGKGLFR